jgi:hypothetical protein
MTLRRAVAARLLRLWRDLRDAADPRRREKRFATWALRVLSMAMILGVIPVWKLIQLGPVGFVLAALKVAFAAALLTAALAAVFAAQEIARRRGRASA